MIKYVDMSHVEDEYIMEDLTEEEMVAYFKDPVAVAHGVHDDFHEEDDEEEEDFDVMDFDVTKYEADESKIADIVGSGHAWSHLLL